LENQKVHHSVERTTLTVLEIAEYLGVSKDLIYQMVKAKQIPSISIGRRILFKLDSVDRWLAQKESESIAN
jgi:excisionase family DNA binding protein